MNHHLIIAILAALHENADREALHENHIFHTKNLTDRLDIAPTPGNAPDPGHRTKGLIQPFSELNFFSDPVQNLDLLQDQKNIHPHAQDQDHAIGRHHPRRFGLRLSGKAGGITSLYHLLT